jgi:predicted nucleic acid-binding protein
MEFARRTGSRRYLDPLEVLLGEYANRSLDFRQADAVELGRVVAARNAIRRPTKSFDAMIAAICIVHGAMLATRNVRDFDGLDLKLVNPFETAG